MSPASENFEEEWKKLDSIVKTYAPKNEFEFDIGKPVEKNFINLGKTGQGEQGSVYAIAQVIFDGGDLDDLLREPLKHFKVAEHIGRLRRRIKSEMLDTRENEITLKVLTDGFKLGSELIKQTMPFYNTADFVRFAKESNSRSNLSKIALKFLDEERCKGSPWKKERIMKEASFLSRLNFHRNIPAFISVFEHSKGSGYFTEYLHMRTLDSLLHDKAVMQIRDIPPKDVVFSIGFFLYDALDYSKKKGIVHLDVKKENIGITLDEGVLKLFDFGYAADYNEKNEDENFTTTCIGSSYYMHPYKLFQLYQSESKKKGTHIVDMLRMVLGNKAEDIAEEMIKKGVKLESALQEAMINEKNNKKNLGTIEEYMSKKEAKKVMSLFTKLKEKDITNKYIVHPALPVYAAAVSVLEIAMGDKSPIVADPKDLLDLIYPKLKDVNRPIHMEKHKYNSKEKEVLYYVFQKKYIQPTEESLKNMPSVAEMRDRYYMLLRNRGYKTLSDFENILYSWIEPINKEIESSYQSSAQTRQEDTKKSIEI